MGKREFTNRMSLRGAYLYATWKSQQNKIVGRDPHVSPLDFLRMTIRMISRDHHVGFSILLRMTILKYLSSKSSLRGDNRGQAIFELGKNKLIRRPFEFFATQKIGVTSFKRGMITTAVILGQQRVTRVSKDIKWTLGSSPRVTGESKSPRVTDEKKSTWVTGERKCPMMTMLMGILISSMSMTGTVRAECVPYPDCASIGYTETSCEGDSLKCPFDTSKLFCIPCDTSFQYTCNGEGQIGQGESCDGKYTICGCSSGYEWDSASESCKAFCPDSSCSVGNLMFTDGTCCSDFYGGKSSIGVIVKNNELVMNNKVAFTTWSQSTKDITSLSNYSSMETAITDYNGRLNTSIIANHFSCGNESECAAAYCNYYATTGTNIGQWYLPAAGELHDYVYLNSEKLCTWICPFNGWPYFAEGIWSSTERDEWYPWMVSSSTGISSTSHYTKTGGTWSVFCFLPINVNNGKATPCGSEYKYRCTEAGESGQGEACGGYYKSCN